jgi:2'-5' RNA ligase
MNDKWRLFIAIELPDEVLNELDDIQRGLIDQAPPRAVRWVSPKGIHLTLRFLGDTPASQVNDLEATLVHAADGYSPFKLRPEGLGAFPNMRTPRVVWVGLAGDVVALKGLQGSVEKGVARLGFPAEEGHFHPHLTLGRLARSASKDEQRAVGQLVASAGWMRRGDWQVDGVSLIRSQLKPDGAVYTCLARIPLEGA